MSTSDTAPDGEPVLDIEVGDDPTGTEPIRRGLASAFDQRWRQARGAVRRRLTDDGGRLIRERDEALAVDEFRRWLRRELEGTVLDPVDRQRVRRGAHWTGGRVRDAYRQGLDQAARGLRAAGLPDGAVDDATSERRPEHREQLRSEFVLTVHDTEDAIAAARTDATRTFREHVHESAGVGRTVSAVNGRLDAVGQTRTTTLANTRIVETANVAALTAYELAGVEDLTVAPEAVPAATTNYCSHAPGHERRVSARETARTNQRGAGEVQFTTAGDDRVCPECSIVGGLVLTISEVKADMDALHPPLHPNCRCFLWPLPMETGGEEVESPRAVVGR